MKSEVRLKSERSLGVSVRFNDLKNGEGVIDSKEHLRLRVSDEDYIYFSASNEMVETHDRGNWPPNFQTNQPIREFKLIAEEI